MVTLAPNYTTQKYTVKPKHRHYYLLALRGGRVVAQCACGEVLSSVEIENVLNMQDVE